MGNNRTSNRWLKYFLLDNGNLHCYLRLDDNIWLEAWLYGRDMTWYDPLLYTPHTTKILTWFECFLCLFTLLFGTYRSSQDPSSEFRSSNGHMCLYFWQVLPMVWVHRCGTWIYKKTLKGRWWSFVGLISVRTYCHVTSKWSNHWKLVIIEISFNGSFEDSFELIELPMKDSGESTWVHLQLIYYINHDLYV